MDNSGWIKAKAVYDLTLQRGNMPWAEISQRMLALIDLLEQDSRFDGVSVFLPMLALGLKIPGVRQAVHVIWKPENAAYEIFLDHFEGEFYGDFSVAGPADVKDVILRYLHRSDTDL